MFGFFVVRWFPIVMLLLKYKGYLARCSYFFAKAFCELLTNM